MPRSTALVVLGALLMALPARADRTWRVQPGDALSVLASRFHVSVDDLREWNGLEDDRILAGQELIVARGDGATRPPAPTPGPTYTIQRGDTLSHIALRFGTDVDGLLELNPGLRADRVRAGQTLRVGTADGRERTDYVVRRGDSLARIASRFRVEVRDLRRWNRGVRPSRLRAGQRLVVWSEVPESTSESIGACHRGRLENPFRLDPHPGIVIRDRDRAWGTLETVLWLRDGFDAVRDRRPRAHKIRVHDLSNRRGGRMHGHRSHQSGRDADLAYYQKRCAGRVCGFRRLQPDDLDADTQWVLFHTWLQNDQVDAIFMDYSLQQPLYEAARRAGVPRGRLARWIQYPRGPTYPLGIVRHYPKHRDHAHVRFTCPDTDEQCR